MSKAEVNEKNDEKLGMSDTEVMLKAVIKETMWRRFNFWLTAIYWGDKVHGCTK